MASDRINNAQRQAFVDLAKQVLNDRIQQTQCDLSYAQEVITENLMQELGVNRLDKEIHALEQQIKALRKQKEGLGFVAHQASPLEGSQAKLQLDASLATLREEIDHLRDQRVELIAKLWATTSIGEAQSLLKQIREL